MLTLAFPENKGEQISLEFPFKYRKKGHKRSSNYSVKGHKPIYVGIFFNDKIIATADLASLKTFQWFS